MAEAFLKQIAGDRFEVESAGLEPGRLNPLAVEAMKEIGIDISRNKTKSVFDLYKQGKYYDYVITVCEESQASKRLHWGFDDPSGFKGSWNEKLNKTRLVRDEIEAKIKDWVTSLAAF